MATNMSASKGDSPGNLTIGEGVKVVGHLVVPGIAFDVAALDAFCLAHIARFKRPKHYCFVDELPKNNYGKVLKTTLREWDAQPSA